MHKLSIVTITLNSEAHLEQSINSVIQQDYPSIEYVLVDGGSDDDTLNIIKKYEDHLARWISEPDDGIADAMNKGLTLATGDFVYFLHSDDYLENENSISEACQYLTLDKDVFLYSIYLEKYGRKTLCKPRGFNWWMNFKSGVFHQSVICKRSLFDSIGLFDTNLRIAMDYDFFLRAYKSDAKAIMVDLPIATMRLTGISSKTDWESLKDRFGEERIAHRKNCSAGWMRLVYDLYWLLYIPYRKLRSTADLFEK